MRGGGWVVLVLQNRLRDAACYFSKGESRFGGLFVYEMIELLFAIPVGKKWLSKRGEPWYYTGDYPTLNMREKLRRLSFDFC